MPSAPVSWTPGIDFQWTASRAASGRIPISEDGTAPERDPDFASQVAAEIGRARVRMRLLALVRRVTLVLMLAAAVFVASRLIEPVVARLIEWMPQFMGVPLPMVVLGGLVAGLVLRTYPHASLRL